MKEHIHIILTGGTIEKSYNPVTEQTAFLCKSILPDYLNDVIKAYPHLSFDFVSQIDSLDMTDNLRSNILHSIKQTLAKKIIVTHGTSTMADTAVYLAKHLGKTDKTIVLTGAMIPLKEFAMSDAGFNLGYAMASVQTADAGIYIAMNASLFDAGKVVKNVAIGKFEGV